MTIERMPIQTRPGYDCISTPCDRCKADPLGGWNHGRSGGMAYYGVRSTLPDGRKVAVLLGVFRCDYPTTVTNLPRFLRRQRAEYLMIHVEHEAGTEPPPYAAHGPCTFHGEGVICNAEIMSSLRATEMFEMFGDDDPDAKPDAQPDQLWRAIEFELNAWMGNNPIPS